MKCTSFLGAALALALPTAAICQETEPAPARWIVQFEHRSVSLDDLHGAILAADAERARALVADAQVEADRACAPFAAEIAAAGGKVTRVFWLIPACVIEGPKSAVDLAARYPGVHAVRRDGWRRPAAVDMRPMRVATNRDNHDADDVQAQGIRGAGVTVAVVDSGLDVDMNGTGRPHAVFFPGGNPANQTGGGIGGSRMLANEQIGQLSADDLINHGTRVAAVAIGARWNQTPQSDDGHAPEARVAGYSLTEIGSGYTTLVTMVSAWQQVVADAAMFGTKVAVMSYDGTRDPDSPEEQAMDAAANVGDLLVSTIAGNDPATQLYYHGAVNVMVVGSTVNDTHVASYFSGRGPLASYAHSPRLYPQLVANGENVILPTADNEAMNTTSSGTSYSAPQVAGAAALFRSVATSASGLETRAAILATLEDVRSQNQGTENAIGRGYLRDDRLIALAQGRGMIASGNVSLNQPGRSFSMPVQAGTGYAVALCWSRYDVTAQQWADLDLRVTLNGQLVGESNGLEDSDERVVFDAPFGGTATIEVNAVRFEDGRVDQDFAIAAAENFGPRIDAFGQGCAGSRGSIGIWSVEPDSLQNGMFGNSSSDLLIGGVNHRTQQWVDATLIPGAFNMRGIALRHDDVATPNPGRNWVDLTIDLSLNNARAATMTSTFAQNDGIRKTRVLTRKQIVLPSQSAPNTDPNNWSVVIPFDQAFDRLYDTPPNATPIQGLVVDVRKYGSSLGAAAVSYPVDAMQGMNVAGGTLYATSPSATTGTLMPNQATVIGLIDDLGTVHYPTLAGTGAPALGGSYTVLLNDVPPMAPALITWGLSRQTVGPVALPADLAVLGAPGCWLYTSLDAVSPVSASAAGSVTFPVQVPNAAYLTGGRLHHQALVLDLGANVLGLSTSNGLTVVVGD